MAKATKSPPDGVTGTIDPSRFYSQNYRLYCFKINQWRWFMSLSIELSKPEYQSIAYSEILSSLKSKTSITIGKIQGSNLKLLQSFIGATGLRNRLAAASSSQPAAVAAITEAIQPAYLAQQDSYSINLSDPQVAALLADAVTAGILTQTESEYLQGLATYNKPVWPDITMRDIVAHFEPNLLDVGDWIVLDDVSKNRLMLRLNNDLPEPEAVRIEMQESHDGDRWTEWRRVAHFMGVQASGIYYQLIPNNGLKRRVRVRGEQYSISAIVETV